MMKRCAALLMTCVVLSAYLSLVSAHGRVNPKADYVMPRMPLTPHYEMTFTPSQLTGTEGWVTVTFTKINKTASYQGHGSEQIAVFSPADSWKQGKAPIKYKFINQSKVNQGALGKTYGQVTFRLLNMRADYSFVYISGVSSDPIFNGVSDPLSFADYGEITQVHLAMTDKPTEMRVDWVSDGSDDIESVFVEYGSNSELSHRVPAFTQSYDVKDMCGHPASDVGWRDPGTLYSAVMTGLEPGQEYVYRIVSGKHTYPAAHTGRSPQTPLLSAQARELTSRLPRRVKDYYYSHKGKLASFFVPQTSPAVAMAPFRFVVFGDMGQSVIDNSLEHYQMSASLNTSLALAAELASEYRPQLINHIGDISYARGYSSEWDNFMAQIEPVASHVPWMTGVGNHERDWPDSGVWFNGTDSGGECGVPYRLRMHMPRPGDRLWYSFERGGVHFTYMSTEHAFQVGTEQFEWLEKDLASVDRTHTPWIVFTGHRPMYIDSEYNADVQNAVEFRKNLEPMLAKYEVDVAFWGHHHSYQRMCMLYDGKCKPHSHENGKQVHEVGKHEGQWYVQHIVIGTGGYKNSIDVLPTQPDWAEQVNTWTHGYIRATVSASDGKQSMLLQYVTGEDRTVADYVTLQRQV